MNQETVRRDPDLSLLYNFLKNKHPENVLTIVVDKNPKYKHKDNSWTWESVLKHQSEFDGNVGILLKTLIVVDFDDKDLAQEYIIKFPILKKCPLVKTKKGFHFYFRRTPLCDLYGLYDHSRPFGSNKDQIDFKTICSTGTAGLVVVPPSTNKKWGRRLWKNEIPLFEGEIFDYFIENWADKKYKKIESDENGNYIVEDRIDPQFIFNYDSKLILENDDKEIIQFLMKNLSNKRSHGYGTWIEIVWCLKNISVKYDLQFSEWFYDLWNEFSQMCPDKYIVGNVKTIWINTIPRKNGKNIGSLHYWCKQDSPEIYQTFFNDRKNIKEYIIDDNNDNDPLSISVKYSDIIQRFIADKFRMSPTRIESINVKQYDDSDKKYIFININDKYCNICHEIHESPKTYIQIELKNCTEKCRINNNNGLIISANEYIEDFKNVLIGLLTPNFDEIQILEEYIINSPRDDKLLEHQPEIEEFDKMIISLQNKTKNMLGYKWDLFDNFYCPIHKCVHDKPENCIYISEAQKQLAVGCNLAPWNNMFPHNNLSVPNNIIQIVTGNTINNIQNNYYNSNDELYDSLFDETFDIFENKELNKLINISFKGYASDIADVFYYLGYNIFGVQMEEKDIWWAWDFKEKKWIKSSHKAHIFCNKNVAEKYIYANKWFRENTQPDDIRLKRLSKIDAILKRLKDKDQSTILAQAAILFKDDTRNFENKIDANKDIINFNGYIFNFDTLGFKESMPEDMVSRSTGYTIPEPDLNQQKLIMDFINDLMPDKSQVDYLLTWIASCLDGWNRDENFHILTGCGRNGKSLLRDLIANAFGGSEDGNTGYYITISSTLLTHERPSSEKPIPDLMNLKGARIAIGSEPEKKKSINEGFLKFITGNDYINGRLLYSNSNVTFSPQHSLALLCNKIPKLDSNDEAAWDRSKIIEFPYKFVTKPTQTHHKKIDKNMKNKLPKLGPQFMLILLEYYKKYKNEGLEPTPEIINITEEIRDQSDYYNEYVKECLELVNDKKMRLKRSDINQHFLNWIQQHPIYKSQINDLDINYLKKEIENKFGKMNENLHLPQGKVNKGWMYIRFYKKEPDFLEEHDYLEVKNHDNL